jgi:hypothetical protein
MAKVRERLAMNKQISNRFHKEMPILNNLNEVEDKEKYRVSIKSKVIPVTGRGDL